MNVTQLTNQTSKITINKKNKEIINLKKKITNQKSIIQSLEKAVQEQKQNNGLLILKIHLLEGNYTKVIAFLNRLIKKGGGNNVEFGKFSVQKQNIDQVLYLLNQFQDVFKINITLDKTTTEEIEEIQSLKEKLKTLQEEYYLEDYRRLKDSLIRRGRNNVIFGHYIPSLDLFQDSDSNIYTCAINTERYLYHFASKDMDEYPSFAILNEKGDIGVLYQFVDVNDYEVTLAKFNNQNKRSKKKSTERLFSNIHILDHAVDRWNERIGPIVTKEDLEDVFRNSIFLYKNRKKIRWYDTDRTLLIYNEEIIFGVKLLQDGILIQTFYGRLSEQPALQNIKDLYSIIKGTDRLDLSLSEEKLNSFQLPD